MDFLKANTTVALGALTLVLLVAALIGAPFAGVAVVLSFVVLGFSLTHTKDDLRTTAQKFSATIGTVVKRHRTLVILVGVYFLAAAVKQPGLEMIALIAIAIKCLTPWKRFTRSLGLDVPNKAKSTKKVDA
jgi:fucose permease